MSKLITAALAATLLASAASAALAQEGRNRDGPRSGASGERRWEPNGGRPGWRPQEAPAQVQAPPQAPAPAAAAPAASSRDTPRAGPDGARGDGRRWNDNGRQGGVQTGRPDDDRWGRGDRPGGDDRRWNDNRSGDDGRRWNDNRRGDDGRRWNDNRRGDDGRRWNGNRGGDDDRRWNDNRRNDRQRYDRRHYPPVFSSPYRYRAPIYRPPSGFFIRQWSFGDTLPRGWYGGQYRLIDWWAYGLPDPPIGYDWVRVGDDALLVDSFSGRVVQVAYNLFW